MVKAYLIGESKALAGQQIELSATETTIGRVKGDIVVPDPRISKEHARIIREGDVFYVQDLDSRNRTFVNGQPVKQRVALQDGDRISIGKICDLLFRCSPSDKGEGHEVFLDDEASPDSTMTITSKLDVGSHSGTVPLSASPEAKLAALVEISRHLGQTLALDAVLPRMLNGLFKVFPQADRGFIVLKTGEGRLEARWKVMRERHGEGAVRLSRKIIRRVMETQQALVLEDAGTLPDPSKSVERAQIRSVICAPLLDTDGVALGVLQLDTLDRRQAFRLEDLDVLAGVAVQASIAVQNARFHERAIQQEKVDLELRQDLELAHAVQRAMLPQSRPQLPGYTFFDHYSPMKLVGGDYYDYVALPDGRVAVIVADVVGHGIAAAMMMAKVSCEAKFCLAAESSPALAMEQLNERICAMNTGQFFSALMVVLNPANHDVTILNAGHLPPIWRRHDGTIAEPGAEQAGMVAGIQPGLRYEPTVIRLSPGESLTLYTDGINEAMQLNSTQEEQLFTRERIHRHVQAAQGTLEELGGALLHDVRQFMGSGPQMDDMCLVCLGRI